MTLVQIIEKALSNLDAVDMSNKLKAQAIVDLVNEEIEKQIQHLSKKDSQ